LTKLQAPTWADQRGASKKRGRGEWSWRLVMRILDSETYAGRWHYGKRNCFTGKINASDYWLTIQVPAIVSEDTWRKAQTQRKLNTSESKRNVKRNYLLRGRVRCRKCNSSVNCYATKPTGGRYYLYYRCNGYMGNVANVQCDLPSFQVPAVDEAVWEWVKNLLTEPNVLEQGLAEYQAGREQFSAPLRDRLGILEDLWKESKSQLDRVLDLYITGAIPRELLLDKKQQLESTLAALEKERENLNLQLDAEALSEAEIQQIREFAVQIGKGLQPGDESFNDRRRIIELLDVGALLSVENGEKIIDVWCFLRREKLSIENPTSRSVGLARSCRSNTVRSHHRLHHTCRLVPWL
jgi:site-specific DNA recombinase